MGLHQSIELADTQVLKLLEYFEDILLLVGYSGRDRGSPQNRRSVSAKKPEPTPEELWQKKHLRCLRAYLDYRSLLLEWKEQYAPKTWTEEWHEKFMTALRELSVVEYYLDTGRGVFCWNRQNRTMTAAMTIKMRPLPASVQQM